MSLQNATPEMISFARCFGRPSCPQCGDEQLAPERSAFVGEGLIHHIWCCDACGTTFRTTVELGREAA